MKTIHWFPVTLICFLFIGCEKNSTFNPSDLEKEQLSDAIYKNGVLISEILADPKQGGVEFIEIYNNSDQIVDLQSLEITTVNANGKRNRLHRISDKSEYLYPGRYKVLSKSSETLQDHYAYSDRLSFHSMETFPTLTNTRGAVLVFQNEELIDSLLYTVEMHDIFIKNTKGVSLERVDFNVSTNTSGNFISAAASYGYGTPGYQNSQAANDDSLSYGVSLLNEKFAPYKDETLDLHIGLPRGGMMANILVFNSAGNQVKKLRSNHRLGTRNIISWDGTDEQLNILPMGVYYIHTELYDSNGSLKTFKTTALLIR